MNAELRNALSIYEHSLTRLPASLVKSFERLQALGPIPVDGTDVTASILCTLKTYYLAQDRLKNFLNKTYRGAAADFFVETLLFYLNAFIRTHKLELVVASEKRLKPRRGSLRPDISIWRRDGLVAVIECKTNLGWNRYGWLDDFLKRESAVNLDFPNAKCFLVVLTAHNWPGFGDDKRVGDQFFTLSKVWPSNVLEDQVEDQIQNPIERLFRQLKQRAD